MTITRRDFLKYCGASAAALGLAQVDLLQLEKALANPNGPTVLWLQGSGCTGCSMSFLNRISTTAPTTAANVLINNINLAYHPNLMALAGQDAVNVAKQAYSAGNYILAVEGGVPTAFGGAACWAWTDNGVDVPFQQVVQQYATRALQILSIGTCASWGGIPAAGANPAGIKGVRAFTGTKPTINIAGCPPHPDWIVAVIARLLANQAITLDSNGRPTFLYTNTVHSACPNRDRESCLWAWGCRGPETRANCPTLWWNNKSSWCIEAGAACYACTEPTFPGAAAWYQAIYNPHGTKNLNCDSCHD